MNDLISVIIPVYNGEKYLETCLNSVINQDYKNLEIIIVNDGSTDKSPEICKSFADKDSRIKFYSKHNGGQASARNFALDRITGKYISFVDNDDWIKPEFISELHNLAVNNDSDIAGCEEFNDERNQDNNDSPVNKYSMNEYAEILLPDKVVSHVINKLFSAKLFNKDSIKVRFPEHLRTIEDMGIFPDLLRRAGKIIISERRLYFYRMHAGNTSVILARTPIHSMERALIFIERYDMAKNWVPDTMPLILKKAVWFSVSAFTWFNRKNYQEYKQGFDEIKKFLVSHKNEIQESALIDTARKIAAKLIISGHMLPFRIISVIRPSVKKIINKIQGTK